MSRRRRSAREKALRAQTTRAKELRRRARSAGSRQALTVATAAAVTLAGLGATGAHAEPSGATQRSAAGADSSSSHCGDAPTPSSDPSRLTEAGGDLFFTADDGVHGPELWTSDGSRAGTVLVKDLNPDDHGGGYYDEDGPGELTPVGDTLFFTAEDDSHGSALWKSDGTRSGTVLVKDVNPDDEGGYYDDGRPDDLVAVGDTLFFTADDGKHGSALWKSDGTRAGTVLVKDVNPDVGGGYYDDDEPEDLVAVGDTLFFTADDGTHGSALWKSDGTRAGTVLVKDVRPGAYNSSFSSLTDVAGTLFFTARDGTHGAELWKSDGTEAGTVLVKDIRPGVQGDYYGRPRSLTDVDGTVFFTADDGTHGSELWKSDGTETGTVLVKDIDPTNADDEDEYGGSLTNVGGTLFFTADDGIHGRELWTTDGTEAGTVQVDDIRPGAYDSNPSYLTGVGSTLFFTARDGSHGPEVWKSDGTEAGTVLVRDVEGGAGSYYGPESLAAVGGTLFFAADDGVHGSELWASDGTEAGTALVRDVNAGGGFRVRSDEQHNRRKGTVRVVVLHEGAGRLVAAPANDSPFRRTAQDVTSAGRTTVTLRPTRAGMKRLRKVGRLQVTARFTFTPCGGPGSSEVRKYTLKLR